MELTREGNPIADIDCTLRIGMREAPKPLCHDCKHVLDLCEKIGKRHVYEKGFRVIVSCNGYEKLA